MLGLKGWAPTLHAVFSLLPSSGAAGVSHERPGSPHMHL